jgi:NADPH2:quinone reductase
VEFLRSLGVQHPINVAEADYVERVLEITGGKGVRYIFNGVGGDTLNTDVKVIAPFGELQAYGYVAGKKPFNVFGVSRCMSLKTFAADDFFPTPMFQAATEAMYAWLETGPLMEANPVLPLEQVAEANRLLDRGEVIGKIALKP